MWYQDSKIGNLHRDTAGKDVEISRRYAEISILLEEISKNNEEIGKLNWEIDRRNGELQFLYEQLGRLQRKVSIYDSVFSYEPNYE